MVLRVAPLALAILSFPGGRALAQPSGAAADLLARHAELDRALRRPPSAARERRLVALLDRTIDYEMIVRRVLVVHWDSLSEAQRAEATDLLTRAIRHRYRASVQALHGWSVEVVSERARGVGRRVETVATRGSETRAIGYDLFERDGAFRVVDLIVEGDSLIHSYRTQFDRVIRREGFEGFLRRLRERVEADAS